MKGIVLGLGLVVALAGAASAGECPLLQAQIDKEYGRRFDKTAASVKSMAAQAMGLHRSGKHAESVKMYDEAAKAGGMKLMHKK
ncbi:MAG: hypothetical protein ACREM3_03660 [Candidatus Rokuibacteriota bacterium]